MDKKMTVIIAAVAVVAVVAIAAVVIMNNNGSSSDSTEKVDFLIIDQDGVFLWAYGEGKNYYEAFKDAMDVDYYDYVESKSSTGVAITEINGLAQTDDYSGYWALYYYQNDGWVESNWYLDNIEVKGLKDIGFFYTVYESGSPVKGGPVLLGDAVPAVTEAASWTGSTDGVLFQVEGTSGFYTAFNGTGTTAFDALNDAVADYKIPFKSNDGGINWLFNALLDMHKEGEQWLYWQQYIPSKDGTEWIMNNVGLKDTKDVKNICLFYNFYGNVPTVPIYQEESEFVTITDSAGAQVTIKTGSTYVAVSSNVAEWTQILGAEDMVVAMCEGAFDDDVLNDKLSSKTKLAGYKTVTAEAIAETGCTYVLSPAKSMALPAAVQAQLESTYGIKTIKVNCYGETMLNDGQNLVKIAGTGQKAYDEYVKLYNEIKNYALEASKVKDKDLRFAICNTSAKATSFSISSISAELSKNMESINGTNASKDLGDTGGSSSSFSVSTDAFYNYDQEGNLDYLFLRSSSSLEGDLEDQYVRFYNTNFASYGTELLAVENGNCYVFETDVCSGCRDFIGFLVFADAFGFDISKYDPVKVANDFNEKYGFKNSYEELICNIEIDG